MQSMTTVETRLESAFAPYFAEIEACRRASTYWALLHVVVALPDICSALESDDGQAEGGRYVRWCRSYLPMTGLTGAHEYWTIRCVVLHQGRTVTRRARYRFTQPNASGQRFHRRQADDGVTVLDVDELATEMTAGVRAWVADLQARPAGRGNVEKHVATLVMVQNQELPGSGGSTYLVSGTCSTTAPIFRRLMP